MNAKLRSDPLSRVLLGTRAWPPGRRSCSGSLSAAAKSGSCCGEWWEWIRDGRRPENKDPSTVLHGDYAATDALPTALGRPYAPACGRDGGMRREKAQGRTGATERLLASAEDDAAWIQQAGGRLFFIDVRQIGE